LAVESHCITTRSRRTRNHKKGQSSNTDSANGTTKSFIENETQSNSNSTKLHVFVSKEVVERFLKGYRLDKDFAALLNRTQEVKHDENKHCAYQIGENELLYFEDADHQIQLCMPLSKRTAILREVHDKAHESAHVGWERTLASLRDQFYWPTMRKDITEYI
jgi:hypothetical protein